MYRYVILFFITLSLQAEKKNVLFFSIDDLRPELACYGVNSIKTPHIDSLASQGTVFEKTYCQQAVCGPSRASIMSGCRPNTTQVFNLNTPLRSKLPNVLTLPQFFKEKDYKSVSIGKIYHHANEDPQGWSEKPIKPTGEWRGRGYINPNTKVNIQDKGRGPAWEIADVPDNAYPDGKTAEIACQKLEGFAKNKENFFLAVGFVRPHLPFNAPKKYWDLYTEEDLNKPIHDKYPEGAPRFSTSNFGELRNYTNISRKGDISAKDHKTLRHGYYATVSYMDAQVGLVMNKLKSLNLDKNTVVVLWGDHGWKLGDYGSWCKHTNFEIDTKVPMIVSAPGISANKTKALAELVDVYPTLAELAGFKAPEHCEGSSLVSVMQNPDTKGKAAAFSQYPRSRYMGHTIADGKWRYTEWIHKKTGKAEVIELYDHSAAETADKNLAKVEALQDTVKRLSKLLNKGDGWKQIKADFEQAQ
ncbi:MAG: sulfatase [Lentisphaeraceae bacterium]|nr:sulfatase [Lentisphaeraceae bacterium]